MPNSSNRDTRLRKSHTQDAIRVRLLGDKLPSLLRDAVLGATDGCVTTFSVVAGAVGGGLDEGVVIILGFANLIADGFSMAASNYLGTAAANGELERARSEEARHIREVPEGEREEIRQIFASKGFTGALLERIVSVITKDKRLWVETMLTEELGLRQENAPPLRAALATFAAFCCAGMVPLGPYLVPPLPADSRFAWSCAATAATFFLIGFVKGLILRVPPWKSGAGTLMLGGSAALLAYAAGFILRKVAGV